MEISGYVSTKLHMAVVLWAAQHKTSVDAVVARALSEYILDVDSGLLSPPQAVSEMQSRIASRQREMVAGTRRGVGRPRTPPPHLQLLGHD